MKSLSLAFLLALPAAAQPLPGWLAQAKPTTVYGLVTAVSPSFIVVSNYTTVTHQGSRTTFRRINNRLTPLEVPEPAWQEQVPIYSYLSHYPEWRLVRAGDRMAVTENCWLAGEGGYVRNVVYFKPANSVMVQRVWR